MGDLDRVDDRTFRVNFSGDGAAKLKDRVMEKLKEFMGDYTDDALVEYVVVLLRNGRSREESMNELNVFLGDDTDSFISWLWDHLASNLKLYVKPLESRGDSKIKLTSGELAGKNKASHADPEPEKGKSNRLSRRRHNQDWKGLVRDAPDPPPLRSSDIKNIHVEGKTHQGQEGKNHCPAQPVQKKRNRVDGDDQQQAKRAAVSQSAMAASRRLLQFAVRDAVATARPSTSLAEPSIKRLRSVVSAPIGDIAIADRMQRRRSVARVPMGTALKAVSEAAEDVKRVRLSNNVFDRLGHGLDRVEDQQVEFRESAIEDGEYGDDFDQRQDPTHSTYYQPSDYREEEEYLTNIKTLGSETGLASDSASDNEEYDDFNVMDHEVADVSQTGTSCGNKGEDSLMVQYSVAKTANEMPNTWNKDQDQSTAVNNNSRKIVNISVNVNTWKPPHYQTARNVDEMDGRKPPIKDSVAVTGNPVAQAVKENSGLSRAPNGNERLTTDSQKSLQSPSVSYSARRPSEVVESRTIFVSNVHFAATKDSLSRHFNKFGEVLKVVIITDAATGQPKGAAYVEFMRKEAADNALSLDGTSFMSRILKVARRGTANLEASPMTRPRTTRGSPFAAARFARGIPGAYRTRLPIKPGARSMQWKRGAQSTSSEAGAHTFSPVTRGLTYVRAEPKPDGTVGAT